jgi:hypothetical protein
MRTELSLSLFSNRFIIYLKKMKILELEKFKDNIKCRLKAVFR